MSRYDFAGIEPQSRVSIGWDRPLQSFFVQVITIPPAPADTAEDENDDNADDEIIVWVGTTMGEIPYAAEAIRVARAHAVLPSDIGATLEMDRLRTAGDRDGPAQQEVQRFLSGDG